MRTFSKDELIRELRAINEREWIKSERVGNYGSIGNTLEDLLGITENNLPIPNASEWELKTQRSNTSALVTLFHAEPSPEALKFVPRILLPYFGWSHDDAGGRYAANEKSFRQTISAAGFTDRGFTLVINSELKRVEVCFDEAQVDERHRLWRTKIPHDVADWLNECRPYWGFGDLKRKLGAKLTNCFFVEADVKREHGKESYWYRHAWQLEGINPEGLLEGLKKGHVFVDFDARSGHNHGTKFRMRANFLRNLYATQQQLF